MKLNLRRFWKLHWLWRPSLDQTMVLNHQNLSRLAGECEAFRGFRLTDVLVFEEKGLVLSLEGGGRVRAAFILGLEAQDPFLAASQKVFGKKPRVPWGIIQFLRAHFKNSALQGVWIAPSDDRRVLFKFEKGEIVFECIPNKARVLVRVGEKQFSQPSQKFDATAFDGPWEFVSALKLELSTEILNKRVETVPSKSISKKEQPPGQSPAVSNIEQKIKKLEKAIEGVKKSLLGESEVKASAQLGEELKNDQNLWKQIKRERPKDFQNVTSQGLAVEKAFGIYKKKKNQFEKSQARLNELLAQKQSYQKKLERLAGGDSDSENLETQTNESLENSVDVVLPKASKKFSGLQVFLDPKFQLWVGRDASQNEELLKVAAPNDTWVHLRDTPGAHGIIRSSAKNLEIPHPILEQACRIVAHFSQSRKTPWVDGEKMDFYVVLRKFLKKPKGLGKGQVIVERETVRRVVFRIPRFEILPP